MKAPLMLGASLLALGLSTTPAFAADTTTTVEELVVTVTKRAQTLQEVPISVAAVTGDALAAQAVHQFTDLQSTVPNLQIDQTNGNYAITIRGLGSGASNLAFEQSVGLFVDGVYSSRARSLQTAFMDVERVEVVRGPQGALFGKNTNAGAISIVSRAPTRDFAAEVRAGAEVEQGGWSGSGYISGPLSDTVAARLSVTAGHDGAYMNNRLTHTDEYSTDYVGGRAQVLWRPTDTFDATLKLEGSQNDIDGSNIVFNKLGTNALGNLARAQAGGAGVAQEWPGFWRTAATDRPDYNNTKSGAGTATLNWKVGDWKLTSITSYSGIKSDQEIDTDVSALKLLDANQAERSSQFFQEFRALGSLGDADITTGVTYMKTKLKIVQLVFYNGAPYGLAAYQANANRSFHQDGSSISPYVAVDYRLSDHWQASASLRYSREEKTAHITNSYVGTLPITSMPYDFHGKKTEGLWDYSARIKYKINPSAQIYLSYATGTKGGGFISNDGALGYNVTFNNGKISYEPEKAKSWELGGKFRLFDGRGDLNVALFSTDFKNLQVSSYTGTAFTTGNAAEATSRGVEIETNWRPTEHISFGGSIAKLDAKYDDYPGAACVYNAPPTCVPKTNNLKGYRLTRAPDWKGNAYVEVSGHVTAGLTLTGRVSADYTDLSYYQSDMNPLNAQKAYTKLNARLGLKPDQGDWELALIGRNLTNEVTFSQAFSVPLIGGDSHGVMINPPRTITLEAVKRF